MKKADGDLWDRLAASGKNIVLYGMGNGAEKILAVLSERGIPVCGLFASEGFASHKFFHGMAVHSFDEVKEAFGRENLLVLLAFGSSRPDVIGAIRGVAAECELYAPDLPPFGDTLFDKHFYNAHLGELEAVRGLFCDDLSRRIFDGVLEYKLSGRIEPLLAAVSDDEGDFLPCSPATVLDVGAYDGDTVRELLAARSGPFRIYALEPDPKTYAKLKAYAEGEARAEVIPLCACAWDKRERLTFDGSHNRNSSVLAARSASLSGRAPKTIEVAGERLDDLLPDVAADYIKFDVEGAEREALSGAEGLIRRSYPTLALSLYHRSEDLFALPLLVKETFPDYDGFYLRRRRSLPAWDLTLYVKKGKKT